MKRNSIIISLLLTLSLPSCTSNDGDLELEVKTEENNSIEQDWEVVTATYKEWAEQNPIQRWYEYMDLNHKIESFCESLTDEIGKNCGNEGFVVSPFSVFNQLAMMANSTDRNSRENIMEVLGFSNIDSLNYISGDAIQQAVKWFYRDGCFINNHIWIAKESSPTREFIDLMANNFNAGIEKIDFSKSESVASINTWMEKYSDGEIKNYINFDYLNGRTNLWANAAYFNLTAPRAKDSNFEIGSKKFYSPDGEVKVDMIKKLNYNYAIGASNEVATMISFMTGGGSNMWITFFVPKKYVDPDKLTTLINKDVRKELMEKGERVNWSVTMPVFDCTRQLDLTTPLQNLGIKNLSGINLLELNLPDADTQVLQTGRVEFKADKTVVTSLSTFYDESTNLVIDRPFFFEVGSFEIFRSTFMTGVIANPSN